MGNLAMLVMVVGYNILFAILKQAGVETQMAAGICIGLAFANGVIYGRNTHESSQ